MSLRRAWAGVGEAFPSSLSPETWFDLVRASDCQSWRCGCLPLPARAAASPSRPWGLGASPELWGSCRTPGLGPAGERKRKRQSWVSKSFVLSCLWDSLPRPGRARQRRRTRAGSRGCTSWWLSLQVGAGSSSPRVGTAACSAPRSCLCAPGDGDGGMGPAGHPVPITGGLAGRTHRRWQRAESRDGAVPSAPWQCPCPAQGLDVSLHFLLTHSGWDRKPPQRPRREEGARRAPAEGLGDPVAVRGRCQCHPWHPTSPVRGSQMTGTSDGATARGGSLAARCSLAQLFRGAVRGSSGRVGAACGVIGAGARLSPLPDPTHRFMPSSRSRDAAEPGECILQPWHTGSRDGNPDSASPGQDGQAPSAVTRTQSNQICLVH